MKTIGSVVSGWIKPASRVLDLGCGDGALLEHLSKSHNIRGYGLEINHQSINACINRGVNVIDQDLNNGLDNFADQSFDTVLMTQTLQTLRYPHIALDEMLRIGKQCIVTFPNFGHWRTRGVLALKGRMPVTKQLSYQWMTRPTSTFLPTKILKYSFSNATLVLSIRPLLAVFPAI